MVNASLDLNPLTGRARIWCTHSAWFEDQQFSILVDLGFPCHSSHFGRFKHLLIFRNYGDLSDGRFWQDAGDIPGQAWVYLGKCNCSEFCEWWFAGDDDIACLIEDPGARIELPADEVFLSRGASGSSFRQLLLPQDFIREAESTTALCRAIAAEQVDLNQSFCVRHWITLGDSEAASRFAALASQFGLGCDGTQSTGDGVRVRLIEWGAMTIDARYHSAAQLYLLSQKFGAKLEGWEADLSQRSDR